MYKYFLILFLCVTAQVRAQDFELKRTLTGHAGEVQNIRFSPNGKILASGSYDNSIILWNVESGKRIRRLYGHKDDIHEVTFSFDGKMLASASKDGTAKVWDVRTGKLIRSYDNIKLKYGDQSITPSVSFVAFSGDDGHIYFGGEYGYLMSAKLGLSPMGDFYQPELFYVNPPINNMYMAMITGGTLSPDRKALVVVLEKEIKIIDLKSKNLKKTIHYPDHYLNDVVVGPGSNTIATWSYDGKVTIWDYYGGRKIKSLQVGDNEDYGAASFNYNGDWLFTGVSGNEANLWDWKSGKKITALKGHSAVVRVARCSPVENLFASASYDGTIKIWKEKEPEDEKPFIVESDIEEEEEPVVVLIDENPKEEAKKEPEPEEEPEEKLFEEKKDGLYFNHEKVEIGKNVKLPNIEFEQGKYTLSGSSEKPLLQLVKFLKTYPKVKIRLEGHTDNIGDSKLNLRLSERRVLIIKNKLIDYGIKEKRIETKAYGDTKPIADNNDPKERVKNRRVEMKILDL